MNHLVTSYQKITSDNLVEYLNMVLKRVKKELQLPQDDLGTAISQY